MSLQKKISKANNVCTVTFQAPKEITDGAIDVKILGDFNNWDLEQAITMKSKNGVFQASVDLERDKEHQFRYLIDNEKWENDPEADAYAPTPFGVENSVVLASK